MRAKDGRISAEEARAVFLDGMALGAAPATKRAPGPAALKGVIEHLGFVQVDTITVVDRAHDLILWSRLPGYRREWLSRLLERDRALFEHWTHDASIIPIGYFAFWKPRFSAHAPGPWFRARLGERAEEMMAHVMKRITAEGSLMSRDFEHERPMGQSGAWWGWKPQKAVLEHLWRRGELMIAGRRHFQKVYDLTERVIPIAQREALHPTREELADWACRSALARLGFATASDLAKFWQSISIAEARAWCSAAMSRDEVVTVMVKDEGKDGEVRPMFAFHDWQRRVRRATLDQGRMRLLCPFDPLIRDRARTRRLFNVDFRFEGFTPGSKRKFGYYVMAILEGDRIVGRFDPKVHRSEKGKSVLEVKGLWWERGVRADQARRGKFRDSLEQLAIFVGAREIRLTTR